MYLFATADTNHFASVNFFPTIAKKLSCFSFVVLFISFIFKVAPPVVRKYVKVCGIVDLCKLKRVFYLEVSTIYHCILGH